LSKDDQQDGSIRQRETVSEGSKWVVVGMHLCIYCLRCFMAVVVLRSLAEDTFYSLLFLEIDILASELG
jgi:hypothetical protein